MCIYVTVFYYVAKPQTQNPKHRTHNTKQQKRANPLGFTLYRYFMLISLSLAQFNLNRL